MNYLPIKNIISLPGPQIWHQSEFLPEKKQYDNTVSFMGEQTSSPAQHHRKMNQKQQQKNLTYLPKNLGLLQQRKYL